MDKAFESLNMSVDRIAKRAVTRRAFLVGGGVAMAKKRIAFSQSRRASLYAYVGCFTTAQRYARGDGIRVYRVDMETGNWSPVQQVTGLVNPSFLVVSGDLRFLYSVHGDEDYATSFSVDQENGKLTLLNRAATSGRNGVHQAVDRTGRFLIVANYATGSISVMPVRKDGMLGEAAQVISLPGQPGPNRVEQASSHPHHVVFDPSGRFVVVPDKGLDRVFVFRFEPTAGKLTPTVQGSATVRTDSGPRHAAFHPTLPVLHRWLLSLSGQAHNRSPLVSLLGRFYLGQVYEATGKRGQAADEYREFLSAFEGSTTRLPQVAEARAALKRLEGQ
jgi:hypothetical protein